MSKFSSNVQVKQKSECIAYVTKDDPITIRYDWFTEDEFKVFGYKKVDIGNFPVKVDTEKQI